MNQNQRRNIKMQKLTSSEIEALREAAGKYREGWGLFKPKTTARLAERGFFAKEKHRVYGMQWRITDAGRAALKDVEGE